MRRLSLPRNGACGLIELVVTVAVMSVILLGVGSAMLIDSYAAPTVASPTGAMRLDRPGPVGISCSHEKKAASIVC